MSHVFALSPSLGLYHLSTPWDSATHGLERMAKDQYIQRALVAAIIYPSSSLDGAGFFVEQKDKMIQPYIHYHGLNDISSAFELLQWFHILPKLKLDNPCHLIQLSCHPEVNHTLPPFQRMPGSLYLSCFWQH